MSSLTVTELSTLAEGQRVWGQRFTVSLTSQGVTLSLQQEGWCSVSQHYHDFVLFKFADGSGELWADRSAGDENWLDMGTRVGRIFHTDTDAHAPDEAPVHAARNSSAAGSEDDDAGEIRSTSRMDDNGDLYISVSGITKPGEENMPVSATELVNEHNRVVAMPDGKIIVDWPALDERWVVNDPQQSGMLLMERYSISTNQRRQWDNGDDVGRVNRPILTTLVNEIGTQLQSMMRGF